MRKGTVGLSIAVELMLIVGGLFFVSLAVLEYESTQSENELALKVAVKSVKSSTRMYFDSLNLLMLTGNMDEREGLHEKFLNFDNIREARVIRGEPVIQQYGPGFDDEKPVDALDRRALNGEEVVKVSTMTSAKGGQERVVTVVTPFKATKSTRGVNCLQCHEVSSGTVNGAIRISYSIADIDQRIHDETVKRLVMALILFVIAMLLFFIIVKRRLITPLQNIGMVAQRITRNDLDFKAESNLQNELGTLMMNMDDMRASIQHAVAAEKEKRNKERALYALENKVKLGFPFKTGQ